MPRTIFSVFFWIWGFGGFLLCSINYLSLSGSVGVGTSTYMALGFLYWLGGMMLFGLSALIVTNDPGAPEVLVNQSLQPAAAEAPIDVSPLPVEKEIETAVAEFRNTESDLKLQAATPKLSDLSMTKTQSPRWQKLAPLETEEFAPKNDRPSEDANISNAAPTHNLERTVFFVVIFLLAMLVVYGLIRK